MSALSTERLVPVPCLVARRAWECAVDLVDVPFPPEVIAELSPTSRALLPCIVQVTVKRGPEAMLWDQAQLLFRLHRLVFARRAA